MIFFFSLVAFLLGAIIASFVGVVVARLNTGEGIARGRSRCDACGHPLDIFDLVPILSYLAGAGRARCCGARISIFSPLTEFLLGALYLFAYLKLGLSLACLVLLVLLAFILALVLYDLAHMILPAILIGPAVVCALFFAGLSAPNAHAFALLLGVALAEAALLAFLHFASSGRWMGIMDAPLVFALALISGPGAILGFLYTFWLGALIGIGLLLARAPGSRMGMEVPFAPYLALGFLLAYFIPWDPFAILSALTL